MGPNRYYFLPAGNSERLVWRARLSLRWQTGRIAALGEAYLTHDPNRTTFAETTLGSSAPVYDKPSTFGFDLVIQASF